MGGDLNLKKSWHVSLMSNQRKVWEAEKVALDERKKVEQLRREREEERAIEELQRLQEASGNSGSRPTINPKIAWMYQGASGTNGVTEEQEGYLLGKRRVDQLVLKEPEVEKKPATGETALVTVSARDITSKAALDPLLAIEKQKQASLQKAMSDPIMRRRLMKEMNKEKEKEEKKHRKHRRDDDERDRDHRSKRRRRSDEDDGYRKSRRSYKRRSPSYSRSISRSRSPYSGRHDEEGRNSRKDRARSRSRSRSSYSRRREGDRHENRRDRTRSPYRETDERRSGPRRHGDGRSDKPRDHRRRTPEPVSQPFPSPPDSQKDADAERAAKLAAMQSNASDLEKARNRRLQEMEARDAEEKAREDKRRGDKNNKFVGGLRKQAEGVGLGERLQRSRGGLERLDSTF